MTDTYDETIQAMRVRDGELQILTPGSMVHRITIDSSEKEVWEPVDSSGVKPDIDEGDPDSAETGGSNK